MSEMGLRVVNVSQMIKMLTSVYVSMINSEVKYSEFPSVMLWGAPGVGKSQGVKEVADEIERQTGKDDVFNILFLDKISPMGKKHMYVNGNISMRYIWKTKYIRYNY